MQSLIVSLALPHLGLLLMNYGIMELSLEAVDLFKLLIHLELLVCLPI